MDHSWQNSATFLLGSPTSLSLNPSVGGCQPYLKIKPASRLSLGWQDWKLNCVLASWKNVGWNAVMQKKKKNLYKVVTHPPSYARWDPSTIRVGRLPVYDVKPCSTESDLLQQREISCGTFVWFNWRSAGVYRSDSGQMIHYCSILLYYCGVNIWIRKDFRSCLDGDHCCVRWSCFHRFALFYHFWT